MADHVQPHFDNAGLCWCPCSDCTLRLTRQCVCMDCPCEGPEDHYGDDDGEPAEWITVPLPGYREEDWKP
jgi:hypothetical protein